MWSLIFLGSTIYYLRQITTWTLRSFQQGMVVLNHKEPFLDKIPEEVLNHEIICKNIIFKFITSNSGLFRVHPKIALFKYRRTGYFPSLLGEIKLNRSGTAQIAVRIPFSIALMALTLFAALVGESIEGVITINSILISITKTFPAMAIFGIFAILGFIMEKSDLRDGITMLRERAKSSSLT